MPPSALRVLFVDDSEEDTLLLLEELRKGGFEPAFQRVDSLPGLIQALEAGPWDVILCDHMMPNLPSVQALESWQRLAPGTPLILVSAWLDERTAARLMEHGARDFIPKLNPARLVPAIRRELGGPAR